MLNKQSAQKDQATLKRRFSEPPDTETVAGFVPGPGIQKLELKFDIKKLRQGLEDLLKLTEFAGNHTEEGFAGISLTRKPGQTEFTDNDESGRYWLRPDERYIEEPREEIVDEAMYSEFVAEYVNTYFKYVHETLCKIATIGRMRVLSKGLYNCNSWHRDPEPRLHIPVISNPGSVFVVNNHCTHLPADGSVYFTDTRGYHTAFNGGLQQRVHIVAALPL
jgi:hypothetical protein